MEPVKPVHKAQDFNRLAGSRPIEIVPITQSQYQRHLESQDSNLWDPLHNKPFDVRAGSGAERRAGRESAWSIRDEIMAKYDALTSLAMAKKTADILRLNSDEPDAGHRPDTLRRKPRSKSKLLFIAE